jgi:hypothetical protein
MQRNAASSRAARPAGGPDCHVCLHLRKLPHAAHLCAVMAPAFMMFMCSPPTGSYSLRWNGRKQTDVTQHIRHEPNHWHSTPGWREIPGRPPPPPLLPLPHTPTRPHQTQSTHAPAHVLTRLHTSAAPPPSAPPEQLGVVVWHLEEGEVVHGAPPLVRHVVQHQHRPRVVVLAVVAVVGLRRGGGGGGVHGAAGRRAGRHTRGHKQCRCRDMEGGSKRGLNSVGFEAGVCIEEMRPPPAGRRAAGWCASRWPQTPGCPRRRAPRRRAPPRAPPAPPWTAGRSGRAPPRGSRRRSRLNRGRGGKQTGVSDGIGWDGSKEAEELDRRVEVAGHRKRASACRHLKRRL